MPHVSKEAQEFARAHPTLLGVRLRKAISHYELKEVVRKRIIEVTAEQKKERGGE